MMVDVNDQKNMVLARQQVALVDLGMGTDNDSSLCALQGKGSVNLGGGTLDLPSNTWYPADNMPAFGDSTKRRSRDRASWSGSLSRSDVGCVVNQERLRCYVDLAHLGEHLCFCEGLVSDLIWRPQGAIPARNLGPRDSSDVPRAATQANNVLFDLANTATGNRASQATHNLDQLHSNSAVLWADSLSHVQQHSAPATVLQMPSPPPHLLLAVYTDAGRWSVV